MEHTQRFAATVMASCALLAGSWFITNAQAAAPRDACARAIALTEQMAEVNGQRIGTMGARSVALRLGMDAKVEQLTPKHDALIVEYQRLHQDFRDAAANCR